MRTAGTMRSRVVVVVGVLAAAATAVAGLRWGNVLDHEGGGSARAQLERATTNKVTPRGFTGYGFDQCLAPSQAAMDAWLTSSPYWAVGIYIAGDSRACRAQPNLTPTWVTTQLDRGWRLLPITLGPQAFCNPRFPRYRDDEVIEPNPDGNYAAARAQGRREADSTVAAATALGIPPGSTLWYDLEAFDISRPRCRSSAMQFLTGWTVRLRERGFVSGAYSSGASGIRAIDYARVNNPTFTAPDMLWIADWNGQPVVTSRWVRADAWLPGARVHQYRGGHNERYGGVTINVDSNFLDVGRGSVARAAPVHCGGVPLDFASYPRLTTASVAPRRTAAAECLLKEHGHFTGKPDGVFDAASASAVRAFRVSVGLSASGTLGRRAWTALLSAGRHPLMKYGAATDGVRRLQRTLNAAVGAELPVTGTFAALTTAAVKTYQRQVGLPATGVVAADTWGLLQAGIVEATR